MRIGVYPGTFDPITIGHMDIIRRSLRVVDKLVVAVAKDSAKKPIFNLSERENLVKVDVSHKLSTEESAKVEVVSFSGLLADFAAKQNASVIIRGLRAVSDFEYEVQMACINNRLNGSIETIFLPASESVQFISSRFIRQIASLGGEIEQFVSKNVCTELRKKFPLT